MSSWMAPTPGFAAHAANEVSMAKFESLCQVVLHMVGGRMSFSPPNRNATHFKACFLQTNVGNITLGLTCNKVRASQALMHLRERVYVQGVATQDALPKKEMLLLDALAAMAQGRKAPSMSNLPRGASAKASRSSDYVDSSSCEEMLSP